MPVTAVVAYGDDLRHRFPFRLPTSSYQKDVPSIQPYTSHLIGAHHVAIEADTSTTCLHATVHDTEVFITSYCYFCLSLSELRQHVLYLGPITSFYPVHHLTSTGNRNTSMMLFRIYVASTIPHLKMIHRPLPCHRTPASLMVLHLALRHAHLPSDKTLFASLLTPTVSRLYLTLEPTESLSTTPSYYKTFKPPPLK